jgi:mRNA-degrading endonuclease RelE of RelBE toxin-antitoxin system
MNYNLIAVPTFKKELKKLAKKYPSLKSDLAVLFDSLKSNPIQGIFLGNNCYKIRLAISSKGKGKSAGARVITNIVVNDETIFLLSIIDKSDRESLSNKEIELILKTIKEF